MDGILVISYSLTGVSRRAAQLLCSHHGWPLGTVLDARPRGTLRCVIDSLLARHPAIRYEGPDPGDFHTVVLVAPIWLYRLASPMRSFLQARRDALQRVALVSTMASGGAVNAVREAAGILGRPPVASAAFTQRELEDGSGTGRLLAFGDAFLSGVPGAHPAAAPAWLGPDMSLPPRPN